MQDADLQRTHRIDIKCNTPSPYRKDLPRHVRGPVPNGIKLKGLIFFLFSSLNLSGSNFSGSGKNSGSL